MAGPALLGPLQRPAGVAVFEGHAQPKRRSLGTVAGDVGAQIDRPEAGAVLVEEPHRCADRDFRPAVVTVGAAHQGLAIPGACAQQDRPMAALLAGLLQLLAAAARPAA